MYKWSRTEHASQKNSHATAKIVCIVTETQRSTQTTKQTFEPQEGNKATQNSSLERSHPSMRPVRALNAHATPLPVSTVLMQMQMLTPVLMQYANICLSET